MRVPAHLKHKPVVVSHDYENIDGRFSYDSDARGISLGLAQWNNRGKVDISAKVWREKNGKWSRLSEELPLHRVLDLAIVVASSCNHFRTSYPLPQEINEKNKYIDRIGLQGDAMTLEVCSDNEHIHEDMTLFCDALAKDDEILSERFKVLASILKTMGY